jgi:hypothetical protein
MYHIVIDANTNAPTESTINEFMKIESVPLTNPIIIEYASTFLGVNQLSSISLLFSISMLTFANGASVPSLLMIVLLLVIISHKPTSPIPVFINPISMKIIPKTTVIRRLLSKLISVS